MKLILSVILLWTVFSTAEGISCRHCTNEDDLLCSFSSVQTCSDSDICLTAYITDDSANQRIYRNCAPASLCPDAVANSISMNLGPKHVYANVSCCSTDQCNTNELDYPNVPAKNTLRCLGCVPNTVDCSSPVECRGEEDTCIEAIVVKQGVPTTFNGCGTANVCDATDFMNNLPFLEDIGSVFSPSTCIFATPTTTTAEPTTTTTSIPTTTKMPTPIATTEDTTIEPTTLPCPSNLTLQEYLENSTALLRQLHRLSCQIKKKITKPHALSLINLHQHLILYQTKLMEQQMALANHHDYNVPLICQQNMVLSHHQLLLHQIHQHLPPQLYIPQLFNQQQLVYQLQQQLQQYQQGLMLHLYNYPLHNYNLHSMFPTE
ncbi:protein psiD-like [Gouania willdenowi]|uniref:protein psiD-like n=1 Tax=Gouania willdenowi TaxID=441366 RepID=UPI0010559D01|nr:protein psiD-like [Gouania willdenowi]